jgi:hypothetical protein
MVICNFCVSIVKDNGNRILVFKNNARKYFFALGCNGGTFLGLREEKSWFILIYIIKDALSTV